MSIPAVDLSLLREVFGHMAGRVQYDLGGKAPDLAMDSHGIERIDCSGFVRYALARATHGELKIPDGSFMQHHWCEQQGLHKLARYSDVQFATNDPKRLFIAFIEPKPVGHVFLCLSDGKQMRTMESYGGHGVGARRWNTPVLLRKCSAAYELPTVT